MLGQTEESKRDKFIDTMPTVIQMHLITEKTWEKTTKKAKEHIISKCDPPAATLSTLAQGTTVPGLYSHISHANDKDETDISEPFKGACPMQPKPRGGGKGKQSQKNRKTCQHRYKMTNTIMRILTIITIMRIIEVNSEGVDPIKAKIQVISSEAKIFMAEANEIKIHTKANIRMLTINTISIMVMMMSTRQTNMVHHVHYALAIITLPNIVSRESMTSMILWKR